MAVVGAATFGADGEVEVGLAALLAAGSLFGAPLGARIMAKTAEGNLKIAFGILMLVVSGLLLWPSGAEQFGTSAVAITLPIALGTVAFGVSVGLLSALFGIGGGVAMVPFMVLLLERSSHLAEGTSLLVIIPTAIAGVIAHHKRGFVSFRHAGWLAVGGVFGAFAGARLALSIDEELLKLLFAVFLALMGVRTIRQGRKVNRNRGSCH
jgi:uncharacterized membrane protein YfcA